MQEQSFLVFRAWIICACVNIIHSHEAVYKATTTKNMTKNLKNRPKPDFSWCRRLSASSLARTSASCKTNVMVFSICPRISSAAAYRRWWTNNLSWNIVASVPQVGDKKQKQQRLPKKKRKKVVFFVCLKKKDKLQRTQSINPTAYGQLRSHYVTSGLGLSKLERTRNVQVEVTFLGVTTAKYKLHRG